MTTPTEDREYRGFVITKDANGWWATTGAGLIHLGPYDTESGARGAVDRELDDPPPKWRRR
jgi:hypothetical protein